VREVVQRNVEKPLLLPERISLGRVAVEKDVAVVRAELRGSAAKRELHTQQLKALIRVRVRGLGLGVTLGSTR